MSPTPTSTSSPDQSSQNSAQRKRSRSAASYWRANLWVVGVLLSIWFLVGYTISIFYIEKVNTLKIGELPLGFWFAQQGSILVFVVLVWLYAILMDQVDRRFQRDSRGE